MRPFRQNPKLSAWAGMEGEYHFNATPIAPPGSAMLMQIKPGDRTAYELNAKKAWYRGPCLNHFRSFWGILPSTKGERISDTVKFQHHAIAMPQLTPADQILETTRQLNDAINQQPKCALMNEITAIDLLREVMLGERRTKLPENSLQILKSQNKNCGNKTTPMPPSEARR